MSKEQNAAPRGPTPETDAVSSSGTVGQIMMREHAKGLECQRNALRTELAEAQVELAAANAAIDANWVTHQRVVAAESALAEAKRKALEVYTALDNLYALVQGESPRLLEGDHHDEMVRAALETGRALIDQPEGEKP